MRTDLLPIIACPICQSTLTLQPEAAAVAPNTAAARTLPVASPNAAAIPNTDPEGSSANPAAPASPAEILSGALTCPPAARVTPSPMASPTYCRRNCETPRPPEPPDRIPQSVLSIYPSFRRKPESALPGQTVRRDASPAKPPEGKPCQPIARLSR